MTKRDQCPNEKYGIEYTNNIMRLRHFTKSAQSTGPENIGLERTLLRLPVKGPVNSASRITLEYNGKIWPQPG
jgi:hypothetical protein